MDGVIPFTEAGSYHLNGGSSRWKIIVNESAIGACVKIQDQEQSESQKDVSTSEYLLRHCHITPHLPSVTR